MSPRVLSLATACLLAAGVSVVLPALVRPAAAQFTFESATEVQPRPTSPGPTSPGVPPAGFLGGGVGGGGISSIAVEGNQRIEAETVRAYMTVKEGDPYDPERIDRSLKALFATGLFADVTVERQGSGLVVKVVENPIINRVAFEGNKRVESDTLRNEVQLKPRQVYTRAKVQEDVKRVLDVYRRTGRFAVTVEPKVIELPQNRVDLAFEINEGPPTYIRRINFVGNQRFSDSRLREVIATREERWYRFFSSVDTYDPDRMTYDRELLRRYYLKNGYSDFRVVSAVAELTPDRASFFVTFTLDEGERYRFGDIDIQVAIPDVKPEDLNQFIVGAKGEWYNADQVESTVQAITDAMGSRGYAFVEVRPRVRRDKDNRVINITYEVQEGPRVYVERIEISGNLRTLDQVIRREMRLVEGDAFNTAKLRRSREKIRNLAFFEKVEVTNVPSETAPDRTVVQVEVTERSTGELSFGVGWSSSSGALFDITMRERNLLGKGQDLRLNLMVAERRQQVDLSFTEPYFLDRRLAAGFDLFVTQRDLQDEASYDLEEKGGALRMAYSYNDYLRHSYKYLLAETSVDNVGNNASRYVKQQEGSTLLSQVSHVLTYDRRDSAISPTEGYYISYANDFAGAGGDETFIRTTVDAGHYFSLTEDSDVVLALSGSAGYIFGVGDDVRFVRNFNLGGDNMRGFEYGGASPRDKTSGDALGGAWIATASAEVRFPLGLPEELGITGKAFSDVGTIGSPDGIRSRDLNQSTAPRVSAGAGIIWVSPMGPVSIDLAVPIVKEDYDQTEFFRFNFGTRF